MSPWSGSLPLSAAQNLSGLPSSIGRATERNTMLFSLLSSSSYYYYYIIIYLLIYRVLYWQEDVKNVCFSSANIHIFSESAALLDDFLKVEKLFLQGGYVHYPFVIVIVIESHLVPLFICEKWHPFFCLFLYNYSRCPRYHITSYRTTSTQSAFAMPSLWVRFRRRREGEGKAKGSKK